MEVWPAGTLGRLNRPSALVLVPIVVPTTEMRISLTGRLVLLSVTRPVMLPYACWPLAWGASTKRESRKMPSEGHMLLRVRPVEMVIETGPPCCGWLVSGGGTVQADADGSSN